jgi:hypothetical protein
MTIKIGDKIRYTATQEHAGPIRQLICVRDSYKGVKSTTLIDVCLAPHKRCKSDISKPPLRARTELRPAPCLNDACYSSRPSLRSSE